MTDPRLERRPPRSAHPVLPRDLFGEPGLMVVDVTWGTLQPLEAAPGVQTVAELEVIDHIRHGGRLVDTRAPEYVAQGTIATAIPIPHDDIVERRNELDPDGPTVLFCNGPPCGATPSAIRALLAAGWPAELLRYYRGGIHDWVTLGLPLVAAGD